MTLPALVVDASALTEMLLQTASGRVVAARLRATRPQVPDILDAEVAAALRRAHRHGALTDDEVDAALTQLLDWPAVRVPSRLLVRGSRRRWNNVSTYDALYLAVAEASGGSVLTCDGRLARAPATGVPVENVRVI